MPGGINVNPELPLLDIGLDRMKEPLEFLKKSSADRKLRIVAFHRLPGLGKTTLLNQLWKDVSSMWSLSHVMVYVEVTESQSVCSLQTEIVQQLLCKNCQITFSSKEFGKGALKKTLQELSTGGKAVFLALDNVSPNLLKDILPQGLDSLFPPSSCIVVTSQQSTIEQNLRDLCSINNINNWDIFPYCPKHLSDDDSKALFALHAGIINMEHTELVNSIVPHCRGLPLALEVWGCLFKAKERREEQAWKKVHAQLQPEEATFPEESNELLKGLELIYEKLQPDCQKAFLNVAGFFYGWRWSTVECIVGTVHMKTLKDYYLISEAESTSHCSQSAIDSFGSPSQPWEDYHQSCLRYGKLLEGKVVMMHDIILKFGRQLLEKQDLHVKIDLNGENAELGNENINEYLPRSRFLWNRSNENNILPNRFENRIRNLLFLHLESSVDPQRLILNVERIEGYSQEYASLLRFQSLENVTSIEPFTTFSPQLRELHFHKCPSLTNLPTSCTKLKNLERLHIRDCSNFERIPNYCSNWTGLQELFLSWCERIVELPTQLGYLPNLKIVVVKNCIGLTTFPELSNLNQLSYLEIDSCNRLRHVPTLPKSLTILILVAYECNVLQHETAPPNLILPNKLEILHATRCTKLSELPEMMGSLTLLRELNLSHCSSLPELPNFICNLTSVETLNLRECSALSKLPQDMGNLRSLTHLDLSYCSKLERLPDSICELAKLEVLDVRKCSKLQELPPQMGRLTCLQKLKVWGCDQLQFPSDLLRDGVLDEIN